ncbi:MAG: helix-turn-helix domain-containing protein, partial [Firmicutes bacterium]|nr:helix-turn-helix domain-containing protein [Bacillota bacterium]
AKTLIRKRANEMRTKVINNTITRLLNFEKYSNFKQALEDTAIVNDFQVVLLSEDFNPLIIVETRHQITIDEAIRVGRDLASGVGDSYRFVEIGGTKTYWGAININSGKYYLLLVDNEDKYSNEEINMLAEIIELSMGMWKYTPERDAKAEFIRALIRGNKSLAYSLREEAGVSGENILSVFFIRDFDQQKVEEAYQDAEDNGNIRMIKVVEDTESYGIILRQTPQQEKADVNYIEECIALFDRIKEDKKVRIFHVTGVDGIEGAGDGLRLINETCSFVENIFPYKRVFSKYELVLVSNCIYIQITGGQLKKNYMDLMEPFRKEGSNKAKQLLETLETFVLDAGMNSAKTSDFLEVHTNTVQYRLKKINEILGAEITGNRVIPGLTVALALRRMENGNNR